MKNTVLLLLILILAVSACKRKNVRGDLKNRREILQASDWKLAGAIANGNPTSFPACQDDNYYVFIPGGSGKYEEGAVNCLDSNGTGNAPTYTPFIWQMNGDMRYLTLMNFAGDPDNWIEWEILNMTFDELKVRQKLVVDGKDVRLDMTYVAIPK